MSLRHAFLLLKRHFTRSYGKHVVFLINHNYLSHTYPLPFSSPLLILCPYHSLPHTLLCFFFSFSFLAPLTFTFVPTFYFSLLPSFSLHFSPASLSPKCSLYRSSTLVHFLSHFLFHAGSLSLCIFHPLNVFFFKYTQVLLT